MLRITVVSPWRTLSTIQGAGVIGCGEEHSRHVVTHQNARSMVSCPWERGARTLGLAMAFLALLVCATTLHAQIIGGAEQPLSESQLLALGRPNPYTCLDDNSTPSAVQTFPGNWHETNRFGQGWDLVREGDFVHAIWYTFDARRKPVWYRSSIGHIDPLRKEALALLYEDKGPHGDDNQLVGAVAFRFLEQDSERVVARVKLATGAARESCLTRALADTTLQLSPTPAQFHWLATGSGAAERSTLAMFDADARPVWLKIGTPVNSVSTLFYTYSNYPGGDGWRECNHAGCVSAPKPAGTWSAGSGNRSSDAIAVSASVSSSVAEVGHRLQLQFPAQTGGGGVRSSGSSQISTVPENSCPIPSGQASCPISVTWKYVGSNYDGLWRESIDTGTRSRISTNTGGTLADNLSSGNWRYQLRRLTAQGNSTLVVFTGTINAVPSSGGGPQGNTIGFRPASACPASATPISPGDVPAIPGAYWNPERDGTSWHLSFPSATQATVAWMSYDQNSQPIWYLAAPAQIESPTTEHPYKRFWSPLTKYRWVGGVRDAGTVVGEVSMSFLPTDATRIALRWKLNNPSMAAQNECLNDIVRSPPTRNANLALTGFWYEPLLEGWGLFPYVVQTDAGQIRELTSLTVYDLGGEPRWVVYPDLVDSTTAWLNSGLTYKLSRFSGGLPVAAPTLPPNNTAAGSFGRSFSSGTAGAAAVNVQVPTSASVPVGVSWTRGSSQSSSIAIAKLLRVDEITAGRQLCAIPAGQTSCSLTVSWTSKFAEARAWRQNIDTGAFVALSPATSMGSSTETFTSAGRFRYFLKNGAVPTAADLAVSAEVVVTGAAPTGPYEPNNQASQMTILTAGAGWQTHFLDVAGDEDWIGYQQAVNRRSRIFLQPVTGQSTARWNVQLMRWPLNTPAPVAVGAPQTMGPAGGQINFSNLDTPPATSPNGDRFLVVVTAIDGTFSGNDSGYIVSMTDSELLPPTSCNFNDWSVVQGSPAAVATPRYSGRCAIRVDAVGSYLVDQSPSNESSYQARFYVYTGARSGAVDVFQAGSSSASAIRVQHDGDQLLFNVQGSSLTRAVPVNDNRWYLVQLSWRSGAGDGLLAMQVKGSGSPTILDPGAITGLSNASDRIEEARLGMIAGAGTGPMHFDAFESRRYSAPVRLCPGDANADGLLSQADIDAIQAELQLAQLAPGQPDANENGAVTAGDITRVLFMMGNGLTCANN